MASYRWHGVDAHGSRVTGQCHAESVTALREGLRGRGIEPVTVRRSAVRRISLGGRPSPDETAAALAHLGSLLEAGMPLNQALRAVGREQRRPVLRDGLRQVRDAVELGQTFSSVAGEQLPRLDPILIALLAAGEECGALEEALHTVADELRHRHASIRQIRRAAAYPAWIAAMASAVVILLLVVVAPRFEALYAQSGAALPWLTRWVVAASHGVAALLPGAVAVGTVLISALTLVWRRWHRGRRAILRRWWRHRLAAIQRDAALERLFRTLGRLLAAGVPLLDALPHAAQAAGDPLREHIDQAHRAVAAGTPFPRALRHTDPATATGAHLAAIGEECGRLDEMLRQAADYHRHRLEQRLERLAAWVEPALITVAGLVTAAIVAALYLPIFQLGTLF